MRLTSQIDKLPLLALRRKKKLPNLVDCGIGQPITENEFDSYKKLYLKPVAIKPIKISDLKCAISLDFEDVLKTFFKNLDGKVDRAITNTPHFRLIEYYKTHGFKALKRNFRELDYYKFFLSFNKKGYKTSFFEPTQKIIVHYTDKAIWKKVLVFIEIFKSIQQNGYLGSIYKGSYISALEIPIVVTRFGWDIDYEPFEIFLGHHRAACLAALDFKTIDVLLLKDIKRASK